MSGSQLYKEQRNDPESLPLLERAFDEKEIDQVLVNLAILVSWKENPTSQYQKLIYSQYLLLMNLLAE